MLADDSVLVAERIAAAGGDVTLEMCPEAFHVWQLAGAGVPESEEALGSLTRFIGKHWSRADSTADPTTGGQHSTEIR